MINTCIQQIIVIYIVLYILNYKCLFEQSHTKVLDNFKKISNITTLTNPKFVMIHYEPQRVRSTSYQSKLVKNSSYQICNELLRPISKKYEISSIVRNELITNNFFCQGEINLYVAFRECLILYTCKYYIKNIKRRQTQQSKTFSKHDIKRQNKNLKIKKMILNAFQNLLTITTKFYQQSTKSKISPISVLQRFRYIFKKSIKYRKLQQSQIATQFYKNYTYKCFLQIYNVLFRNHK
eukprot:TRINITY_DN5659_c1_g1_i4.p1 TRINITY_DN5659_c1_g1~~TRINITY_DN5659_c1_g1_i4.p1  ORF type:complete len:237 (+),score=-24.08 TRINITY_DN5659_c1_g1_i4:757-1467(+)